MEERIRTYVEEKVKKFHLPKELKSTVVEEMVRETLIHQSYPRREVVKYLVDVRGVYPTDACDIVDSLTHKKSLSVRLENILREKEISVETLLNEATKK